MEEKYERNHLISHVQSFVTRPSPPPQGGYCISRTESVGDSGSSLGGGITATCINLMNDDNDESHSPLSFSLSLVYPPDDNLRRDEFNEMCPLRHVAVVLLYF